MKISVIIPLYKVADYVSDCLRSVLAQEGVDMELILVDDASPDGSAELTGEILRGKSVTYKLIKHSTNKGLSAARNTGIRAATGEYVFFLDSDDELEGTQSLSSLLAVAKQSGADCVIGNYKVVSESGESYTSRRYAQKCYFPKEEVIYAFTADKIPVMAFNKLMKRSFLLEHDLFFGEGLIHEDELWNFMIACAHASVALTGKVSYVYKIRSGSIMTGRGEAAGNSAQHGADSRRLCAFHLPH